MLFGGPAGKRLKPVGEMGRAQSDRPLLHRVGDVVGDCRIERPAVTDRRQKLFGDFVRKIPFDRRLVKDILSELVGLSERLVARKLLGVGCDLVNGADSAAIPHLSVPPGFKE